MKPTGSSATLSDPTTMTPLFMADVVGTYVISLVVSNEFVDSPADSVTIVVSSISCTNDNITIMGSSGFQNTGPSQDFIPLCDGWVLLGDRSTNQILLFNAVTGAMNRNFQLTSSPGDLEFDTENSFLYITQSPATKLVKIDIESNTQTSILLDGAALHLALGNDSKVFTSLDDSLTWPNRTIALIDGVTENVEQTWTNDYDSLLVYDRPGDQLIIGTIGSSPSSLSRYSFDSTSNSLTLEEELWDAGSNGQDLAISPNGNHIAFPCGGGNGLSYTIFDFDSDDLSSIYGEWNTGAYPQSAAFSPDGNYLVATNRKSIQVFNVTTHVLIQEYPLDFSACGYSGILKVGFSRGGNIVFAFTNCGFDDDSGRLFWAVFVP